MKGKMLEEDDPPCCLVTLDCDVEFEAKVPETTDWIRTTLESFDLSGSYAVSVSEVSVKEMKSLCLEYLGTPKVTDVLSFPLFESRGEISQSIAPMIALGDIVLCSEQILAQAKEHQILEREERAWCVVHSMLHLLGMDHEDLSQEREMRNKETEILASLGLKSPWEKRAYHG